MSNTTQSGPLLEGISRKAYSTHPPDKKRTTASGSANADVLNHYIKLAHSLPAINLSDDEEFTGHVDTILEAVQLEVGHLGLEERLKYTEWANNTKAMKLSGIMYGGFMQMNTNTRSDQAGAQLDIFYLLNDLLAGLYLPIRKAIQSLFSALPSSTRSALWILSIHRASLSPGGADLIPFAVLPTMANTSEDCELLMDALDKFGGISVTKNGWLQMDWAEAAIESILDNVQKGWPLAWEKENDGTEDKEWEDMSEKEKETEWKREEGHVVKAFTLAFANHILFATSGVFVRASVELMAIWQRVLAQAFGGFQTTILELHTLDSGPTSADSDYVQEQRVILTPASTKRKKKRSQKSQRSKEKYREKKKLRKQQRTANGDVSIQLRGSHPTKPETCGEEREPEGDVSILFTPIGDKVLDLGCDGRETKDGVERRVTAKCGLETTVEELGVSDPPNLLGMKPDSTKHGLVEVLRNQSSLNGCPKAEISPLTQTQSPSTACIAENFQQAISKDENTSTDITKSEPAHHYSLANNKEGLSLGATRTNEHHDYTTSVPVPEANSTSPRLSTWNPMKKLLPTKKVFIAVPSQIFQKYLPSCQKLMIESDPMGNNPEDTVTKHDELIYTSKTHSHAKGHDTPTQTASSFIKGPVEDALAPALIDTTSSPYRSPQRFSTTSSPDYHPSTPRSRASSNSTVSTTRSQSYRAREVPIETSKWGRKIMQLLKPETQAEKVAHKDQYEGSSQMNQRPDVRHSGESDVGARDIIRANIAEDYGLGQIYKDLININHLDFPRNWGLVDSRERSSFFPSIPDDETFLEMGYPLRRTFSDISPCDVPSLWDDDSDSETMIEADTLSATSSAVDVNQQPSPTMANQLITDNGPKESRPGETMPVSTAVGQKGTQEQEYSGDITNWVRVKLMDSMKLGVVASGGMVL
ncbi:hypothetical protein EX30DRAFT_392030 [Ascodesmis nigricans]|uniref:Uncharacterized protein n=1 Tax=Ascodesmis nigricans TaxID=341454 RepID=A0A4S2N632_9PEZI|nr:hypothetical protein EX30DRAFT_392030 [Ascodesmis nigricans]